MTPRSLAGDVADVLRFWRYMDRRGPVSRLGTRCWVWTGYRHEDSGYGVFSLRTGSVKAHRFAYWNGVGRFNLQLQIDHKCRTTSCVRPDHLEPVTDSENQRRKRHAIQDQLDLDVEAWEAANRGDTP